MKLNEITETGFYYQPEDTDRTYIYEVIKNTDEEWLKDNPKQKFLIDEWLFDYTDHDDKVHYGTAGNLIAVENASPVEVVKITDRKYKVEGRYGECLIEDKPTYKEQCKELQQDVKKLKHELSTYGATGICEVCSEKANEKLDKIQKICTKASNITQFVGGTEVKDAQKLALKILKIIGK